MNGVLVVNKPKDYTSRDIVNIISKKFNTKKVGHTGTLDPLAEGVLIVPIGKALKVAELLTSETKEYVAEVILGYETDMLDITGTEIKRNIPKVTKEDIENSVYLKEVDFNTSSLDDIMFYLNKLYEEVKLLKKDTDVSKKEFALDKALSSADVYSAFVSYRVKNK